MLRALSLPRCLLAFAVAMLLFAQISGLHRHFHAGAGLAVHQQQSELHFGDAGLHADEHAPLGAEVAQHPHADIEMKVLGEAFAKFSSSLLSLGLLMVVLALLAPICVQRLRRGLYVAPPSRRHPFALHPPANGPPGLMFQLV